MTATPLLTLDEICRVPNIFPAGSDMARLHEYACSRTSMTEQEELCAMPNSYEPGSLGDQLHTALCNPSGMMTPLPNLCEMAAQAPEGSEEMTMYTMLCQRSSQGADISEIQSTCQRNALNLPAGSPEAATHFYACR